jgi:phosphoglycolate phosphatase-like HAD superfamily hydrolase
MKAFLRESLQCYTEVIEVARKIKESGFTVGIMSNHSVEWFDSISSKFNLGSIFPQQTTIVSQAVGAAKPDAAIMDILMSALSKEIPSLQREEVR